METSCSFCKKSQAKRPSSLCIGCNTLRTNVLMKCLPDDKIHTDFVLIVTYMMTTNEHSGDCSNPSEINIRNQEYRDWFQLLKPFKQEMLVLNSEINLAHPGAIRLMLLYKKDDIRDGFRCECGTTFEIVSARVERKIVL